MRKPITLSFEDGFVDGLRKRGHGNMSEFIETAVMFYVAEKDFVATVKPVFSRAMMECLKCPAHFSLLKCGQCPACGSKEVRIENEVKE